MHELDASDESILQPFPTIRFCQPHVQGRYSQTALKLHCESINILV
jgi:hypothetical protein